MVPAGRSGLQAVLTERALDMTADMIAKECLCCLMR